ncbi:MAG TPA: class I SAM-dependent methyltransferase [Acidocella sp.]|uniref:class I SAM-dependent methyltransferase n=1 Tax=Acidiphilium sp. 20-67-58 TaxID=1970291 RepID=UPI000BC4B62B|nr:class I SAM-dependent methyltransferase [Acidiphilium sp. 20-67-58]OYV54814.1 MAG: SAM-dependent methyltransferase [Acidiphilium sp. 20-67-58]HQT37879.1 class I SAM-dependent methyltransferase [Acidocella sp.]
MSFYQHHILPPLLNFVMRQKPLQPFRERVISQAVGNVLEIGIGSGLNLPLYKYGVHSVTGVEPSSELLAMAEQQAKRATVPIELLHASAESLPLESNSVDTVVTTWALCTIPDANAALQEARRVLRPGGKLLFVEHGRAPEKGVARWQDRIDPLWGLIAGGCHLNRQIDALITEAGFQIDTMRHARMPGPRTHNFLYEGQAHPQ